MDRRRNLIMAGATVLLAIGAGQYMATGTANSTASLVPVTSVAPQVRLAAETPFAPSDAPQLVPAAATPVQSWPKAAETRLGAVAADCPVSLDVFTGAAAMLSVTLSAPCAPNQSIVLRHAGLAVTYQTTASGSFFGDIPALDAEGVVTVRLPDGTEVSGASPVPEVETLNRLVVQTLAEDPVAVRMDGVTMPLGAEAGPLSLRAEVASWPVGGDPPLVIEAEVTPTTCGRELLGEVLLSQAGKVSRADLAMSMPECDGMGGYVALNNPVPDLKLAATE